MSVRQEHRYVSLVRALADAKDADRIMIEAAFMDRPSRERKAPAPIPCATRSEVRRWMRINSVEYDGATQLAEAANIALDLPSGAMDDETHWVWDEAMSAIDCDTNRRQS